MAIAYGGDYNPEQWPEDVWAEDVALMRRAGVTLVTVNVFGWARTQRAEGAYDFGWLDRVLDVLHAGGVAVDLATGTASPPPWAVAAYPRMLPRTRDGVVLGPGSRQHYAPTSPDYRRLAAELVRATARRYAAHPAVVLWHVNNELGCHVAEDFSDNAAVAFRAWLRERYGDLDALDAAWGTAFWSQRHTAWDQVQPPRRTPASVNPAALLDFRRFSSDALRELFRAEKRIIREAGATQPVTTNLMGAFAGADYWSWADDLDVISDDSYPDPRDPDAHRGAAFARDLMRSLKPGTPWLLMEQAPNAVNWRALNVPKAPGQMAALSVQAVGRGADGVLFFQWRQSTAGSEKFHSAMLPHAGTDTRTYREVERLGADLAALGDLPAPGADAAVAVVLDWDTRWALDQPDHPARVDHAAEVRAWHAALQERHVQVDLVPAAGPFDGYRLVLAPCLYLLHDAAALVAYVRAGGRLLTTAFTDVVDGCDRFLPGGFATRLAPVLGLSVADVAGAEAATVHWDGTAYPAGTLVEELRPAGAAVLGAFGDGAPALTRHAAGGGEAYHLATLPGPALRRALAGHLLDRAGVAPVVAGLPAQVEAARRGDVVTLVNQAPTPARLPDGTTLGPYGWRVSRP